MAIYRVRHVSIFNLVSEYMNIHHYDFPDYLPTATELQEFVDGFDAAHKANLRAHYHTNVAVQPVGVRRVDLAEQPEQFFTPTAGLWSGQASGEPIPPWLGVLTVWKGLTTFPRTSRAFGMPVTETANQHPGTPTPTIQAAYTTYGNELLSIDITGQEAALKVAAEYQEGTSQIGTVNPLTIVTVRPFWGTQRRRRPGVGS